MKSSDRYRNRIFPKGMLSGIMILLIILLSGINLNAQIDGEALFKQNCSSCHTASTKRSTGPGLSGVTKRRSIEWILKWVANSTEMVNSGDPDAVAIFKEYNNFPMPAQSLKGDEVIAITKYLDANDVILAEKAKADSLAKIAKNAAMSNKPAAKAEFLSRETKLVLFIIGIIGILLFFFMNYVNRTMVESVGHGLPYFDNTEDGFMDQWIAKNKPFVLFLGIFLIIFCMRFIWAFINHL
ncbi:hypothetical protein BH09BAC5_BH09BAC5_09780 [soil metagenome]